MPFSINIRLRKPSVTTKPEATTDPRPPPSRPSSLPPTSPPSPLPETPKATSPVPTQPSTTSDSTKKVMQHHPSPPAYSTRYENFLLMLIGTYLLWALFYCTFLLLRLLSWLIEKLEELFTHVMKTKFGPVTSLHKAGLVKMSLEEGSRKTADKRLHITATPESDVWTVLAPDGGFMECIVQQRSGSA